MDIEPIEQPTEDTQINSIASMFEKSLPRLMPSEMPNGYYTDRGLVYVWGEPKSLNPPQKKTFKFTWRHWAFLWGIIASVVEALMIIHGGSR